MDLHSSTPQSRHVKLGTESLVIRFFAAILIGLLLSWLIFQTLWLRFNNSIHIALELSSVFIGLSAFTIVWHTFRQHDPMGRMIGFGLLAAAIFNSFHVYYSIKMDVLPMSFAVLSGQYGAAGRLTEAIVMLITGFNIFKHKTHKGWGFCFALLFALTGAFLIQQFTLVIPDLRGDRSFISLGNFIHISIVIFFLFSLYGFRKELNTEGIIGGRSIFYALMMAAGAGLCFFISKGANSFFYLWGHVLKTGFYYLLFRGIFVNGVSYPYEKMTRIGRYMEDILNELPLGLITYDENNRVSFLNTVGRKLLRWGEDDILGKPRRDMESKLLKSADIQSFIGPDRDADTSSSGIRIFQTDQGERMKLNFKSLKTDHGLLVLFDDAKKEQELENLQLQTQTILNAIHNLILVYDKDGKIILCNKSFEKTAGLASCHVLRMSIDELLKRVSFNKSSLDQNSGENDELAVLEGSIITPEGKKRELLIHHGPIYNIDREIIGYIVVGSDISQIKKEHRRSIQNEKLAILGQMGAEIVHETKNYLMTIKGNSQLLNLIAKDEQVKKYAQKIDRAIDEVNDIITGFLSLAKPRPLVLGEFSLNQLINAMEGMFEASVTIKGVKIEKHLSPEERFVVGDEAQIKQVIFNIVKNATEAMNWQEDALLIIETKPGENPGEMQLLIIDNGKGMSTEQIKKLGKPFFTTKKNGTGLGLNVCFRIMKEHGGRIEVESQLGKGTTFILSLPISSPTASSL